MTDQQVPNSIFLDRRAGGKNKHCATGPRFLRFFRGKVHSLEIRTRFFTLFCIFLNILALEGPKTPPKRDPRPLPGGRDSPPRGTGPGKGETTDPSAPGPGFWLYIYIYIYVYIPVNPLPGVETNCLKVEAYAHPSHFGRLVGLAHWIG